MEVTARMPKMFELADFCLIICFISKSGMASADNRNDDTNYVSSNDRSVLLQPIIGLQVKPEGFLSTTWLTVLQLLLILGMGVSVIMLNINWPRNLQTNCESYFLIIFIRVCYWMFSHIHDKYLRKKHIELRIEGHLEFYTGIKKLADAPHLLTNIFNALLLTVTTAYHMMDGDNMNDHCLQNVFNPGQMVAAIILVESAASAIFLILYLSKVRRFNNQKPPPDALRHDWMSCFIRESYSGGEIGYREGHDYVSELLDKQADLLRYFKEQNERLVQKVMILSMQLQDRNCASTT